MGILTDQSTSWLEAAPAFLVAIAILFLPGLTTLLLARLDMVMAAALAPLLSTGYLVAIGIICGQAGVSWSPAVFIPALVVLALAAGFLGRRLNRTSSRKARGLVLPTAAGVLLAAAVVVQSMRGAISTPTLFPQQPDTIFHLGAAQWMLETGDVSVLHAAGFGRPIGPGFYPAAFHDVVATTAMLTGSSVVVATSVTVLAIVALVWPLGCVALALTLFGGRPAVPFVTALLSVAFTGFPFLLMGAGVLWPNLFGQALLPAALAIVLAVVGSAPARRLLGSPALAGVLLVAAVPTVVTAHPNAFVALCLISGLILVCRLPGAVAAARQAGRTRTTVASIVAVVALGGVALVALYVRPSGMFDNGTVGPQYSSAEAWRETLLFAGGRTSSLPVLAVLVVVGVIVILVRRVGAVWVVLALVSMLALFWLNLAVDSEAVRFFTWPWYNVGTRIQAVAILPAIMAAVAAMLLIVDVLGRLMTFTGGRQVAVVAVTTAFLASTGFAYVQPHRSTLRHYFEPPEKDSWATVSEQQALRSLATHLPDDAVVAANPWRGGIYLYIVSGRHLLLPSEKVNTSPDRQLLSLRLDEVGSDRAVCAAAEREHVEWALTGGSPNSRAGKRSDAYRGIDAVGDSPAWRPVATAAPYTLYERVACAR